MFRPKLSILQCRLIVGEKLLGTPYGVAHREPMPGTIYSTEQYENNRAEQSHDATRARERGMRKIKSVGQAQRILGTHATVRNLFIFGRDLIQADHYRNVKISAFAGWSRAVARNCQARFYWNPTLNLPKPPYRLDFALVATNMSPKSDDKKQDAMEEYLAAVTNWISSHESLLSGLVAIAILVSIVVAGVRKIGPKFKAVDEVPSITSQLDAALQEPVSDQDIRYCQTGDGKRIAYAVIGKGTPVVRVLGWFTHLEAEWSSPVGRGFWQRLARQHQLIRYDGRGMGLSEASTEFTAESRELDLEAVIEAAGLDKFALVALSEGTRTAVRYAVKHPERVTHLVLYGSALIKNERRTEETIKNFAANHAMIAAGWGKDTHRKFFADLFLGQDASPEEIEYFTEIQKCSAGREVALTYFESLAEKDQGFELAAQLGVPTLVAHKKDDQMTPFQDGRDLAAQIPGAIFKPLEGDDHFLMLNSERTQSNECIRMIELFLET